MKFDKAAYKASREQVINLIKASHPKWETTEGFTADGVICPDIYGEQPLRILCILAEPYGYAEDGMKDIENQPTDDFMGVGKWAVKTPRNFSILLWLLLRSLENNNKVLWPEFPDLFQISEEHTAILQKTLSKVAWINVKKASKPDGTEMDADEVYEHALKNKEILNLQIQAIQPHLIMPAGEVVFRAMHDAGLLGEGVEFGRKWQIQEVKDGPSVLEVTHPSRWWKYEELYERFGEIYDQREKLACLTK